MKFDVILLAAGKSVRMGMNKMILPVSGEVILERALEAFLGISGIEKIIIAVSEEIKKGAKEIASRHHSCEIMLVEGGNCREESVYNCLKHVDANGVLIHDGARPFVSTKLIKEVMEGVEEKGSCVPGLPITDSIRRVDDGLIVGVGNRNKYWSVQTPQGYVFSELSFAFENMKNSGKSFKDFTDESEIYLSYVKEPYIIPGEKKNRKITDLGDLTGINSRIGSGYDIHVLTSGRKLIICGMEIDFELGCLAHSDGDVGIHALIDALLSASGELDIGSHFPDSDVKYSGIDSTIMLSEVIDILTQKNHRINNVSITILLEKPKIQDYIPLMRVKLANLLKIPYTDIAISAKTAEGLGDIGESKAIAAYAMVILT